MLVQNTRVVNIADEAGERQGVVAEVLIDGAQLEMLLSTDLTFATRPLAEDCRPIVRSLAEAVQSVLS